MNTPHSLPSARLSWRHSLQARVWAGTLVGVALALAVAGLGLHQLFGQHVQRQLVQDLQRQRQMLVARLVFSGDMAAPALPDGALFDPRWHKPFGGLYWQLNGPQGQVVARSRSLWDTELKPPADALDDGAVHTHHLEGPDHQNLLVLEQAIRAPDPSAADTHWTLLVGADLHDTEAATRAFGQQLALALLGLLVLLGAAAAAQVWFGLAPLRALRQALNALGAGQTQRLQGQWPAEVQPLAQDFNRTLDMLDTHVQSARAQAGDLAHALKTPLAVMQHSAQTTMQAVTAEPDPAAQSANQAALSLAQQVLQQVDLARQQVDRHLRRARASALAASRTPEATDLTQVLAGLVRVMHKVHAQRHITLHTQLPTSAVLVGVDSHDLHDVLGNLLDNACQWARTQVQVAVNIPSNAQPPVVCLTLTDDGPGIPPAERARMLQRGTRLDETTPGSGLGLSIARELIDAWQGELALTDAPGGGLCVTVRLPLAGASVSSLSTSNPS